MISVFKRYTHLLLASALTVAAINAQAVEVDVLVLYDQATENDVGRKPTARVNSLIEESNIIYENSEVDIQLRLVGLQKFGSYPSNQSSGDRLYQLAINNEIKNLRSTLGADLVVQLTELTEECGRAYITLDRTWAYSVMKQSCGAYTFAHELGHNMGLGHSRRQVSQGDTPPNRYDYGLGHGVDNSFVTIMAYPESFFTGNRVSYFSNPSLNKCGGQSCGIAEGSPESADAAKAMNLVKSTVANYRINAATPRRFDLPSKIEAEDYNSAPNDSTPGNQNTAEVTACVYYGMNADVQNAPDGTCNIGWTTRGEELIYHTGTAGDTYSVSFQAASRYAGKRAALYVNGAYAGEVSTTGKGWNNYERLTIDNVQIPSYAELKVIFKDGSFNLDYLDIGAGGSNNVVIKAVDFSYATGISLVTNGTAVGYFDAGDQLQYANTDFDGLSSISIEYAARWAGRELEIRRNWLNGPLLATVTLPKTDSWSKYESITIPVLSSGGASKLVIKGKTGNSIANIKTLTLQY